MSKYYDNGGWEKVGSIGIDAGLCWIGDPCYIIHKTHKELAASGLGKDWVGFCKAIFGGLSKENDVYTFGAIGVAVSTGYGDGEYSVYIKRDPKTGRIAEAKVVFIGDED